MPRFRYTIVNEFLEEGVDASFDSDEELVVGAIVPLGDRRYRIERIHDQGGTEWDSDGTTTVDSRLLHCRRVPSA
jgi:uncharacterized Zn finger protein